MLTVGSVTVVNLDRINSVGPQWWIVYFRFEKSGTAAIIDSYFIQNKSVYILLIGLPILGSLGHFLNVFCSHIKCHILKALSITSILHFKFSSYSISFKRYGMLKLSEKGCLRDKMPYLLPLGPWRDKKDIY